MLTSKNVNNIRQGLKESQTFRHCYQTVLEKADRALIDGVNVPVPKDDGGGYTHEQHKKNYQDMLACGIVYQVSGDKKYAKFVRSMLLNYADQYEKWPLHPKRKSSNPAGRVFWQSLNDCVWQVYTIQAYDLIYNTLKPVEKQKIEQHLFLPVLKFLTIDNAKTFNQIHNHGTWALAAVGMTGYVLQWPDYVVMSLKGSKKDGKTGYWAQLNQLFSPDGYYKEGPYYERYALLPFLLFSKAIQKYQPELAVYKYRDGILYKAIETTLQLTYTDKTIFPINDAIKDKTYETEELVYALDIAYADIQADPRLLNIAQKQNRVIVSDAGLKVARDMNTAKSKPFIYTSNWLRDGPDGTSGGIGLLRKRGKKDLVSLLLKATVHGMDHGHFDRLNVLYNDNGTEIFSDYGSVRLVNIETKSGGGYAPENSTWARQTIAHNTVVVDQTSHFGGLDSLAELYHPDLIHFSAKAGLQVASARESNAYQDVRLTRTCILLDMPGEPNSLFVNVFKVNAQKEHQYDLPFWYQGIITDQSFNTIFKKDSLNAFARSNGYQHLWLNATSLAGKDPFITMLVKNRFYTTTIAADSTLMINFVTLGANDPQNNLRKENAFILSKRQKDYCFVTITEPHGNVDTILETVTEAKRNVSDIKLVTDTETTTVFTFLYKDKRYSCQINYQAKTNFLSIKPVLSKLTKP